MEEKSAGVILFNKINEIEYLLLKYPSGHWDFVKGNIEKGEKDEETIIREAYEETSINDIEVYNGFHELIEYNYYNKKKIHKTVSYYVGETHQKEVKISFEHKDYRWLNYLDALKLITFNNSKKLLKQANKFINEKSMN